MSKQIYPLVLHIVQTDESIETIAKKYQTTTEEILFLNPSSRIKTLTPGQPLNVPDYRDVQSEANRHQEPEVVYNSVDVTYLTKESISAKAFYPEAVGALTKTSHDMIDKVVSDSVLFQNVKPISELVEIFQKIFVSILDFVDIIKKKNAAEIKKFQESLEKIYLQLENKISDILRSTSLDYFIKNIFKLWQLYILKILTFKFDEAQEVFQQIIERAKNLFIKKA